MKPQLADNWLEGKTKLPAWAQPKIDGVRGLHITGQFTGRSLKPFKNKALTEFWSHPDFKWLDGELIMPGADYNLPRLCSLTTGLCNTVKATEIPDFVVFDFVDPAMILEGYLYSGRYEYLQKLVTVLQKKYGTTRIRLIDNYPVNTMEELLELDDSFLDEGMEGTIIRNPNAHYSGGRPSVKIQELMRIKRFIDFEFVITHLIEAQENQNEAKINELGHTERSSHQENKVGKGMVGTFKGKLIADVMHDGKVLFPKDMEILVGPGQSTHDERRQWWKDLSVVGQIAKAKTFPQGVKDKPRMPIFLGLRSAEDMS